MTRDDFRQQMDLYRQAREQNPQLSYWEWKANRPQDNDWQYQQWRNSLPENLRQETNDYDLYGAYKAGMQPHMENDGYYHLGSRDPYTGRILKTKKHPTYQKAIESEIKAGYFPHEKDGWTYTKTYSPIGDLSGYAEGTDENGIQLQANKELTPEQKEELNQRMFQMRRMSGGISPVFNIQTVSDFTPIGNVTTAYDAYNSVVNGDYLTASLIGAAALAPKPLVKAAKRVWHKIPEVNPKYFENKLTEFFDNQKKKKLTPNGLNAQIYQDAINQRNQIIEDLYTNPQYWERAEAIKRTYGDDYTQVYKDVLDTYENNYLGLPEPRAKDIDAKAEMAAKEDVLKRYIQTGKTASLLDFDYNINPYLDLIDNSTTRHELSHYIDFNLAQNSNPDFNNEMLKELKKDLSKNDNSLIPKNTDYFRKGTEQKSYMNTLRQFMYDRGLINSLGEKVTTRKIKEAIKLLPSQMNAVKAAYLQFKSPGQYTKWFNKIPLLGTTGATLYLTTEQEENKSN